MDIYFKYNNMLLAKINKKTKELYLLPNTDTLPSYIQDKLDKWIQANLIN